MHQTFSQRSVGVTSEAETTWELIHSRLFEGCCGFCCWCFCCLCPAVSTQKGFLRSFQAEFLDLACELRMFGARTLHVWWCHYFCLELYMSSKHNGLKCRASLFVGVSFIVRNEAKQKIPHKLFLSSTNYCIERVNCFLGYWTEFATPLEECALSRQEEIRSYQNYLKQLF